MLWDRNIIVIISKTDNRLRQSYVNPHQWWASIHRNVYGDTDILILKNWQRRILIYRFFAERRSGPNTNGCFADTSSSMFNCIENIPTDMYIYRSACLTHCNDCSIKVFFKLEFHAPILWCNQAITLVPDRLKALRASIKCQKPLSAIVDRGSEREKKR